jgi:hypothetical protein
MKKIYISLPIGGHEDTVKKRYEEALEFIKNQRPDEEYEVVGPINIDDFDDNGLKVERDKDWAWYMGQDLEQLLRCDAILMCNDWQESDGCRVEFAVANERHLELMFKW